MSDPYADGNGSKKWPMSDPFWQGGGCVCGHKGQNSQNSLFVGYLFAPYIVITHKGPSLIGRYIKAKKLGFWIGHFIVYSSVLPNREQKFEGVSRHKLSARCVSRCGHPLLVVLLLFSANEPCSKTTRVERGEDSLHFTLHTCHLPSKRVLQTREG